MEEDDFASDVVCCPDTCQIIGAFLAPWDVSACRLVCKRWRDAFAVQSATAVVHEGIGINPPQFLHTVPFLTLLLDDARLPREELASQQAWARLRDAVHRGQCPSKLRRLRLHWVSALTMQYTLPVHDTDFPSTTAESLAETWPQMFTKAETLELLVGSNHAIKARTLAATVNLCPSLTALTLQVAHLDAAHWDAITQLTQLTSLALRWSTSTNLLSGMAQSAPTPVPADAADKFFGHLQSLTLSSPRVSSWVWKHLVHATGLRSLALHGGRLLVQAGSPGLACLNGLSQLKTLAFVAPLLTVMEWEWLAELSSLTELRINDWRSPVGQPTSLLVPGQQDLPSAGLDLRPLAVLAPAQPGDSQWLETALNFGPREPPVGEAPVDEQRQEPAGRLGTPMPLGTFSQLRSLRVCLSSPRQLASILSHPDGRGLPATLRTLHIAFTDGQGGRSPAPDALDIPDGGMTSSDGSSGAPSEGEAVSGLASCPVDVCTAQQLRSALRSGPSLSRVEQEAMWCGLARCCPRLSELNVRRSWTLVLDEAAAKCLQQGLKGLQELQFCGAVDASGEMLQLLCRMPQLVLLSLGSIWGVRLVIPLGGIPSNLQSLSLLNATLVTHLPHTGMEYCASGAQTPALPKGLRQLQLKLCCWASGAQPAAQQGCAGMLAAVAACTCLRELRLGFEGQATATPDELPEPIAFGALAQLRNLRLLDLMVSQAPTDWGFAQLLKQVAGLRWLSQLRLSLFARGGAWDAAGASDSQGGAGSGTHQEVVQALCGLTSLRYLQSLEVEVLTPPTAAVLQNVYIRALPNCRLTLVVDNFSEQLVQVDQMMAALDGELAEPLPAEEQEALEAELAALEAGELEEGGEELQGGEALQEEED